MAKLVNMIPLAAEEKIHTMATTARMTEMLKIKNSQSAPFKRKTFSNNN